MGASKRLRGPRTICSKQRAGNDGLHKDWWCERVKDAAADRERAKLELFALGAQAGVMIKFEATAQALVQKWLKAYGATVGTLHEDRRVMYDEESTLLLIPRSTTRLPRSCANKARRTAVAETPLHRRQRRVPLRFLWLRVRSARTGTREQESRQSSSRMSITGLTSPLFCQPSNVGARSMSACNSSAVPPAPSQSLTSPFSGRPGRARTRAVAPLAASAAPARSA
jgi:hypothetical protein